MEQQPRNIKPEDVVFVNKAAEALGEPTPEIKPFNGLVVGGVFMMPHPDLTEVDRRGLAQISKAISQHKS